MRNIASGSFPFLLLFLLLICVVPLRAQYNPQSVFDRANDHLQSNEYHEALSLYHSLENKNRVSGSLYLNMGISYVQLDSLGKSKYYFLKAKEFEEVRPRAVEGLEYVESRFNRQSAVLPKLPWDRFFDWLGETVGVTALLAIGIIALNTGIIGFTSSWFFSFFKKYFRICGIGLGVMGIVIICSSFYLQYLQTRYSPAVMVRQQASVLERPGSDSGVITQAYEGYTFTVDHYRSEEENGWSYVRMSNGLYGWIPDTEIMIL